MEVGKYYKSAKYNLWIKVESLPKRPKNVYRAIGFFNYSKSLINIGTFIGLLEEKFIEVPEMEFIQKYNETAAILMSRLNK